MIQVELIKSIGDVLRALDLFGSNQPANESLNSAIEELRNNLAKQQLRLAINHFELDRTAVLQETREVKEIVNKLYSAFKGTDKKMIFEYLGRLTESVDSLIGNTNS